MKDKKPKILIADPDPAIHTALKAHKQASQYQFASVHTGFECLTKIDTWKPDLLIIELHLPQIHGIEILRKIKSDPRTKEIGVIITSSYAMIQNYKAAVKQNCNYFLEKPFDGNLFSLIKNFFEGKLQIAPFSGKTPTHMIGKHCYLPCVHAPNSYIKFWGTRGSNPVSGPDYVRFGGNTACLEVRCGSDLIIIDAGTGIRPLGNLLADEGIKHVHLLIGHTHWDHLAGFPFFEPIYNAKCQVTIWTPIGFEKSTRELFTEMLAYAYFPVRLDDMQGNLNFKDIIEGEPIQFGSITVTTTYAYHPGATVCFKISMSGKTIGYATDNEFLMGYHGTPHQITKNHALLAPYKKMLQFFKGCDLLVHEAQYTPVEYQTKVGWGHSSITNATILMKHVEAHEWILTHHDPKHTDADLLKKIQLQYDILDDCQFDCRPRMAFDGMVVPI
ncbi:MAG: response regulator [Verrucomicrobia bacterium]|nr:response regulator [Verrucomicrobiota bacterium]